jgi:hypothetical protein
MSKCVVTGQWVDVKADHWYCGGATASGTGWYKKPFTRMRWVTVWICRALVVAALACQWRAERIDSSSDDTEAVSPRRHREVGLGQNEPCQAIDRPVFHQIGCRSHPYGSRSCKWNILTFVAPCPFTAPEADRKIRSDSSRSRMRRMVFDEKSGVFRFHDHYLG